MSGLTRRQFVQSASALIAAGMGAAHAVATPFGVPLGLQLYSVRELLPHDLHGTLSQIAALGYREVETAGYFNYSAEQFGAALKAARLRLPSAHYPFVELARGFDAAVDFSKALGLECIVCSFPGLRNPERLNKPSFSDVVQAFTIDDFRWNADQFNAWGARAKAAGMRFGYHNHTMEFAPQQGIVPYEELLRLSDPSLVTMELDCGWVMVGGADPVDLLERHADRITMLHVKDFKRTDHAASVIAPPPAAELGQGTMDYHRIFRAARKAKISHCYVEQEEFDGPQMQALKTDADYMKALKI